MNVEASQHDLTSSLVKLSQAKLISSYERTKVKVKSIRFLSNDMFYSFSYKLWLTAKSHSNVRFRLP